MKTPPPKPVSFKEMTARLYNLLNGAGCLIPSLVSDHCFYVISVRFDGFLSLSFEPINDNVDKLAIQNAGAGAVPFINLPPGLGYDDILLD